MNLVLASIYFVCFCDLGDGSSSGAIEHENVTYDQALTAQKKHCGELMWTTPGFDFHTKEEAMEAGALAARCEKGEY